MPAREGFAWWLDTDDGDPYGDPYGVIGEEDDEMPAGPLEPGHGLEPDDGPGAA
jgi:hypothetical protein